MPFLKDLSLMQKSCKNQKKYSLSEPDQIKQNLTSPDNEVGYAGKKGILLRLKKASLTVEAAFVLPLFIMVTICMASVMGVYSKTLDKMAELRSAAETAAAAAGVSDDEMWIELPEKINYTPLFLPDGLKMFGVWCSGSARAWTGRSGEYAGGAPSEAEQYVYVAENGTVYHTSSCCTHINLSISKTDISSVGSMRNENGGKYTECEKCGDNTEAGTDVYITSYGDRYHSDLSCSGLKRSVRMVEISRVNGLQECERCALQR